jgi:imidazolonepropionase-like amidohydrolase
MSVTMLRNASVLDPGRGELAEGQSVVIDGARIADVGPGLLQEFVIRSEIQPPADLIRSATTIAAPLLDLDGKVGVVGGR